MPSKQCRAKKRHAQLDAILHWILHPKTADDRICALKELEIFFRKAAASNGKVTPYLDQIHVSLASDKYIEEDILDLRAMIAYVIAPHLMGMSRPWVKRRLPWGE